MSKTNENLKNKLLKPGVWGFPDGAVVNNPPANTGDTGSSPGPGRSHMPQSNKPVHHNYWACALEPACLEPVLYNERDHHNEKPAHHNEE